MWSILLYKFFFYSSVLIAFELIEIDIATNRWRGFMSWDQNNRFADRNSDFPDRIAIYCEVLINCLEVDLFLWSSIFCILYSFGKVGNNFQILFRDGMNHWPEFIWNWLTTILRPQLYLFMERKILLLRHRLFIMIFWKIILRLFFFFFTWLLSWHKRSLVVLKLLNGRSWIQQWWCARNQAMFIYLIVTSLFLEGSSAHCFLLYA